MMKMQCILAISVLCSTILAREIPKYGELENNGQFEKREIRKRVAVSDPNKLWPEGVIPYEIDRNCSLRLQKTIHLAMEEWESKTCVKFIPAEPEHEYRIIIKNKGPCGCCASTGRVTTLQYTTFHESCKSLHVIVHELGHVLGFHHEQRRPDRDKYIKIMYDNIQEKSKHNFNKLDEKDVVTLGFGYDFTSIMHYSATDFGIENKKTIQSLNDSFSLSVQNKKLSETDIAFANKLYKCPKCYIKPTMKSGRLSLSDLARREKYCEWYIKRNPGEFIEFYFENLDIVKSKNCSADYLQFQEGYWSKSPIIDRVCGKKNSKTYYKTRTNNLLITYKSSTEHQSDGFSIMYRVICNGTIRADHGEIQSPEFHKPYRYDSACEWTIIVPPGYKVALSFKEFHIPYSENCKSDYVEILEKENKLDSLLKSRFCGNTLPNTILSSQETLTVRFASESKTTGTGFSAAFTKEINECELPNKGGCTGVCIDTIGSYYCECEDGLFWFNKSKSCEKYLNSCGGTLQISNKTILVSPSFPNLYPSDSKCTWKILNENVRISFLHMDIYKSTIYCYDKLIFRGKTDQKVYCGSKIPNSFYIKREPNLEIEFTSNNAFETTGFAIVIEPV